MNPSSDYQRAILNNPDIEWIDVPGFEGCYKVCREGLIRSLEREARFNFKKKIVPEYILQPTMTRHNRLAVSLTHSKRRQYVYVHRLIATIFIPNPKKYKFVLFKDNNPYNCRSDNLYWSKFYR